MSGNNAYTGTTSLRNGTLRAGSTDAFSRNSDFTVNETATVDLNGFSQTIRSLSLDGMLSFGQPGTDEALKRSNSILTVSGNYSSNNGLLILNTTEDAVQQKRW